MQSFIVFNKKNFHSAGTTGIKYGADTWYTPNTYKLLNYSLEKGWCFIVL